MLNGEDALVVADTSPLLYLALIDRLELPRAASAANEIEALELLTGDDTMDTTRCPSEQQPIL